MLTGNNYCQSQKTVLPGAADLDLNTKNIHFPTLSICSYAPL